MSTEKKFKGSFTQFHERNALPIKSGKCGTSCDDCCSPKTTSGCHPYSAALSVDTAIRGPLSIIFGKMPVIDTEANDLKRISPVSAAPASAANFFTSKVRCGHN